ncbi:MAG TPA: hypothetical protein VEF34_20725 [Syntrophobacteraceae bacterium]|nr:hypothetical protein [Syntrophobacteraceae bacterium]
MRKLFLIFNATSILLLLHICWLSNSFAQSGREALRSLQKLQSRCETGISLNDYMAALGEARFEVKQFSETNEASKKITLCESLKRAIDHYMTAGSIWEQRLRFNSEYYSKYLFCSDFDKSLCDALFHDYPDAYSKKYVPGNTISLSDVISTIWAEASKEIDRASHDLKNPAPKSRSRKQ